LRRFRQNAKLPNTEWHHYTSTLVATGFDPEGAAGARHPLQAPSRRSTLACCQTPGVDGPNGSGIVHRRDQLKGDLCFVFDERSHVM
jgi:hypothetical protein